MPPLVIRDYGWLMQVQRFPHGTYIFADRERLDVWQLRAFSNIYKHLSESGPGYRVLNNPARAMCRSTLLRSLFRAGINDFNAYLLTERMMPARYPVFIRRAFDHNNPLTALLHDEKQYQAALDRLYECNEPEEGLLVVEYCAEPVADGLFRKLSAYRVGDQVMFYNTVHQNDWLVKQGTMNAATDELYQDEQEKILHNAYADEVMTIFETGHIDYGRLDFGIVGGRIQAYEINTNPDTSPPSAHPNPIRVKSQQFAFARYCDAMAALDTTDEGAPLVGHPRKVKLRPAGR